jgi:hypothetical protein
VARLKPCLEQGWSGSAFGCGLAGSGETQIPFGNDKQRKRLLETKEAASERREFQGSKDGLRG